jgi:hypothetical protein
VNLDPKNEGNEPVEPSGNDLFKGEIELVKKASRAFAVCHINEIYDTIKSIDPTALKKCDITKSYPYYMYVFIHQEESGKIDRLDIFSEPKSNGDGLCEVKEIYHSLEHDDSFIEGKKKNLEEKCKSWGWDSLELPRMNAVALCEGIRLGISVYVNSLISTDDSIFNDFMKDAEMISLAHTHHMDYKPNPV